MRCIALVLVILLTETSLSFAQDHKGTPQEQQACTRDAQRFCRQQLGDDGAVQQCLQQNRTRLSKNCQKVFASHRM
jgi:Cysteine rich repeat